ncbi:AEL164Cp [Eremothecium gossypii ATCC 10895]|uniref:3-ketodihydrosphingosine reductase TSC10 n=1 Tax=Eremothecium gossypii (strain ATCC 10895 / CBS 109.51 / FGSC 9923 / NRRL Y-1056) TaxID=284811 RepID=KDSR_EREGS|nr:AEL164Cp [Eremothecium gossypii ATCC 10895]Q758B6.1 RecName: Full=3-ketodihydrosphingosine reductase TSC10; AltName: Full=3-dehydrosphinganine reductase; AltName: Full=KDS reductase [Eremothecium gossypii ATCC 10895]AAS52521.1 AEL164Cp [Eremothecium gossypii ATCC 10895]AEY96821.1 FAEL164Cp [Eremothecium gossypii FDAG1]
MKYELNGQVVLISGGSQGLGRAFAQKYIEESDSTVVIVSRSEEKLTRAGEAICGGARRLGAGGAGRLLYYACNLGDAAAVGGLFATLADAGLQVTQVLFCAGGAVPGLFAELSSAQLAAGVEMNYGTALHLAHGAVRHGARHLVFFSSAAAVYPFIGYSQYAPLKAALRALVAVLRQECDGVRVSCVYPGNFASEGYAEENRTKPAITAAIEGSSEAISCAACCDKIVRGLRSGYDDVTTDFVGWLLLACNMGFNYHSTTYFLWPLGWLLGALVNLLVVPIYMLLCRWDIHKWRTQREETHLAAKTD